MARDIARFLRADPFAGPVSKTILGQWLGSAV